MANFLIFSGLTSCTVNGTDVTSPYTLKNGDVIVATLTVKKGFYPEANTPKVVFSLNGENLSSVKNILNRDVADEDVDIAVAESWWKGSHVLNINYTETMTSVKCTSASGVILATQSKYCDRNVKVMPKLEKISVKPSTDEQTVEPSEGYAGIRNVTVAAIKTETKSATPTKAEQIITPASGKYLSKVNIGAIPDEYIVPEGTKEILENGAHDVTGYASVSVNVTVPTYDFETYVGGGFNVICEDLNPEATVEPAGMVEYYNDGGTLEFTALKSGVCTVIVMEGYLGEGEYQTVTEYSVKIIEASEFKDKTEDGIVSRTITSYTNTSLTSIGTKAFAGCTSLASADLSKVTSIAEQAFADDTALTKLVIRTSTVCALANTNAFTNTPIASGTGYIYVTDTLADTYKTAENWSTYASQIKAISELA